MRVARPFLTDPGLVTNGASTEAQVATEVPDGGRGFKGVVLGLDSGFGVSSIIALF